MHHRTPAQTPVATGPDRLAHIERTVSQNIGRAEALTRIMISDESVAMRTETKVEFPGVDSMPGAAIASHRGGRGKR